MGRCRALRCASALRAESRLSSCFPTSTAPWPPTATVEMTESDAAPLLRAGWARVDPSDQAVGAKLTLGARPATDEIASRSLSAERQRVVEEWLPS